MAARTDGVEWADGLPGYVLTRVEGLAPVAHAALPITVGHSRIETNPEAGLVLGAGEPAILIAAVPERWQELRDALDAAGAGEMWEAARR